MTGSTTALRPTNTDPREWASEVMSALSRLPAKQAAVLRLVYGGRMTQAEVAKKLGSTLDEVKSLVAAGLRTLGAQLLTR